MSRFDFSNVRLPTAPSTDQPVLTLMLGLIGLALVALLGGALDFCDGVDRLARDADVLARKYRWGVSTSWPPALLIELGGLATDRTRAAVDTCILDYYQRDNWHELEQLVVTICSHASVSVHRARVMRDLVGMLRAANSTFNPATFALPTLFSELEGICRDFAGDDLAERYASLKTRPTIVKHAVRTLRASAYPIERHGLHLVANVVYKTHRQRSPRRGKRLSRHIQLHHGSKGPRHLTDVVRLLLLIDLVAYLIDVHRGLASEYHERRRAWGEYLSDASARGQKSIKLGIRPSELLKQQPLTLSQGNSATATPEYLSDAPHDEIGVAGSLPNHSPIIGLANG
jgi:hypothetical protein